MDKVEVVCAREAGGERHRVIITWGAAECAFSFWVAGTAVKDGTANNKIEEATTLFKKLYEKSR